MSVVFCYGSPSTLIRGGRKILSLSVDRINMDRPIGILQISVNALSNEGRIFKKLMTDYGLRQGVSV